MSASQYAGNICQPEKKSINKSCRCGNRCFYNGSFGWGYMIFKDTFIIDLFEKAPHCIKLFYLKAR